MENKYSTKSSSHILPPQHFLNKIKHLPVLRAGTLLVIGFGCDFLGMIHVALGNKNLYGTV